MNAFDTPFSKARGCLVRKAARKARTIARAAARKKATPFHTEGGVAAFWPVYARHQSALKMLSYRAVTISSSQIQFSEYAP